MKSCFKITHPINSLCLVTNPAWMWDYQKMIRCCVRSSYAYDFLNSHPIKKEMFPFSQGLRWSEAGKVHSCLDKNVNLRNFLVTLRITFLTIFGLVRDFCDKVLFWVWYVPSLSSTHTFSDFTNSKATALNRENTINTTQDIARNNSTQQYDGNLPTSPLFLWYKEYTCFKAEQRHSLPPY